MRTLAITGAGGFVGRHLLAAAPARGWRVRALLREPGALSGIEGIDLRCWHAGDEPARTADLLEGSAVLCHLAAFIPEDTADPAQAEACFRVNTLGTLALIQAAVAAGVPRLVHLSTGSAYAPGVGPAIEDGPLYPSARAPYYLSSKLAGEVIVDHAGRDGRLATCILRVASTYGQGMGRGVVRDFALRLRAGQPVTLSDGGRYGTDLVHVDDVVAAILAAADSDATGPINVGSGVLTTVRDIALYFAELAGAGSEKVLLAPAGSGVTTPGSRALDLGRARALLAYAPTSPHEGLARYFSSLSSES
jgi:UDP-glucose 4-epimerase